MRADCEPFGRRVMCEGLLLQVLGGLQVGRDFSMSKKRILWYRRHHYVSQ